MIHFKECQWRYNHRNDDLVKIFKGTFDKKLVKSLYKSDFLKIVYNTPFNKEISDNGLNKKVSALTEKYQEFLDKWKKMNIHI